MPVTYMLRRTLCPWKLEELVAETIDYARKSAVDEIAWISESTGMYRELLPIEGILKLIPGLRHAKKQTEAAGMLFSINPLTTIGHSDFGVDVCTIHPDMQFMVDYSGAVSKACACPLSPSWRTLMVETFRLYAETKPVRLWIEDDFRYSNHGAVIEGCFCDLHLDAFAQRTGKRFTREELVERILRPGTPAPIRHDWLQFLGETLEEVAGLLARAVHKVSPATQVAWMARDEEVMQRDGIDTGRVLQAMANGGTTAIRMTTAGYVETAYRGICAEDENLKHVIPYLPDHTLRCTEIESFPHTLYAKSASGIAAQIEWAAILDVPHQTLNIFDYIGSPMELTPEYGAMLASRKAEFNAFADAFAGTAMDGIGICDAPRMPVHVQTREGKRYEELATRGSGWVDPLRAFGFPIVFGNDQNVTAVSGQTLRALNESEIKTMFSKGVLLDGTALEALCDMGYAHLAGVEIAGRCPVRSRAIGSEELVDPEFGGREYAYTWTLGLWPERILKLQPGAREISRILDPGGAYLFPAFALYENDLGGRVACCPYDLAGTGPDPFSNREPMFFYSEYRKQQIRAVVRWLARGRTPMRVDARGWVLPHQASAPGRILGAVMNVNADTWHHIGIQFTTQTPVAKIMWCDIDGTWKPLDPRSWSAAAHTVSLELQTQIPHLRTVAIEAILTQV